MTRYLYLKHRASVLWIVSLLGIILFADISQANAMVPVNDIDGLEVADSSWVPSEFDRYHALNVTDNACPLCWWFLRAIVGRRVAQGMVARGLVGNAVRSGVTRSGAGSVVRGSARGMVRGGVVRGSVGRTVARGATRAETRRQATRITARTSRRSAASTYQARKAERLNTLRTARSQGRTAATTRQATTVGRGMQRSLPSRVTRAGTHRQTVRVTARNSRKASAIRYGDKRATRRSELQQARRTGHSTTRGNVSRSASSRGTNLDAKGVNQVTKAYKHNFRYADRVRMRAMEDPLSHNFPYSFDDAILATRPMLKRNGYKIFQLKGNMNGKSGVFEIGLTKDGVIDHRFFRPLK